MKKFLIFLVAVATAFSFALTSCSSDEPENKENNGIEADPEDPMNTEVTIVGIWRNVTDENTTELIMYADGSFTQNIISSSDLDSAVKTSKGTYTYTASTGRMVMRYSNDDGSNTAVSYDVVLTATQLTLTDKAGNVTVYQKFTLGPSGGDSYQ